MSIVKGSDASYQQLMMASQSKANIIEEMVLTLFVTSYYKSLEPWLCQHVL